jgi:hypothetical protein
MVRLLMLLPLGLFASEFDHSTFDRLLKHYVNQRARVNYTDWKKDGTSSLDEYLTSFSSSWPAQLSDPEKKAALINLYNAHTIRWVLRSYPAESIWSTSKPFKVKRHQVDGTNVSLDDIETKLRQMGDPRIHAVLVCAARSCPPLRGEAYVSARLDQQLDDNTRAWLGDTELNSFDPARRLAEISPIFKWYRQDFASLEKFLAEHGPPDRVRFLASGKPVIRFKSYSWGLNDATDLGLRYSAATFWWDYLRNK